ncbi:hypothetical protein L7F22_022091 [Adiantum nelumboides]|nr:hypothetical protein [Adiantum nelumboides]
MKGTLQYCKFAASSGVNGAAHSIKMTEGRELRHTEWTCAQSQWCLSAEDVPDWPFLATYLISEASKGKDSPWHSYISALPKKPESILLWSETETRNYLFASSIMNQALERIAEVENTFDSIDCSIYKKHSELFSSERIFWSPKDRLWSGGVDIVHQWHRQVARGGHVKAGVIGRKAVRDVEKLQSGRSEESLRCAIGEDEVVVELGVDECDVGEARLSFLHLQKLQGKLDHGGDIALCRKGDDNGM